MTGIAICPCSCKCAPEELCTVKTWSVVTANACPWNVLFSSPVQEGDLGLTVRKACNSYSIRWSSRREREQESAHELATFIPRYLESHDPHLISSFLIPLKCHDHYLRSEIEAVFRRLGRWLVWFTQHSFLLSWYFCFPGSPVSVLLTQSGDLYPTASVLSWQNGNGEIWARWTSYSSYA